MLTSDINIWGENKKKKEENKPKQNLNTHDLETFLLDSHSSDGHQMKEFSALHLPGNLQAPHLFHCEDTG